MYGEDFHEVIGKTVKAVYVNTARLSIETDDGTILEWDVEGDCCSHSYYHALSGVDKIIGKKIVGVDEIELDKADADFDGDNSDWGETQVYGYRIKADTEMTKLKGTEHEIETSNSMIVEFRNDSNGYYGGMVCSPRTVESPSGELVTNEWGK